MPARPRGQVEYSQQRHLKSIKHIYIMKFSPRKRSAAVTLSHGATENRQSTYACMPAASHRSGTAAASRCCDSTKDQKRHISTNASDIVAITHPGEDGAAGVRTSGRSATWLRCAAGWVASRAPSSRGRQRTAPAPLESLVLSLDIDLWRHCILPANLTCQHEQRSELGDTQGGQKLVGGCAEIRSSHHRKAY